ncbi:hypothetical protein GCM10025795_47110 [Verticiella sediminum]
MAETKTGSKRGFASMDPQRQREIASMGGRAAHASGNAHQFTPEEARAAGARSHARQAQQQAAASSQPGGMRGSTSKSAMTDTAPGSQSMTSRSSHQHR